MYKNTSAESGRLTPTNDGNSAGFYHFFATENGDAVIQNFVIEIVTRRIPVK